MYGIAECLYLSCMMGRHALFCDERMKYTKSDISVQISRNQELHVSCLFIQDSIAQTMGHFQIIPCEVF